MKTPQAVKKLLVSFLIVGVSRSFILAADCPYFRLSMEFLKCEAADAKALDADNPYDSSQNLPELQEADAQALIRVTCSCTYSLSGSDPRCDTEQVLEKSAILGADDVASACRRKKTLCRDVCPSRLP